MNKEDITLPIQSRFLLYQTEDGQMRVEVRLENETVWLNQSAMAELFQSSKQNISLHFKNIFNERELEEKRVVKECLTTAADGKSYRTKFYNLEAIIAVGCVGVMGKGLALQFKKAFPENFQAYEAACRREEVRPGRMFVFETGQMFNARYIINFPTKRHWRGKSCYGDIASGLQPLVREVRQRKIHSIAIPPLGSGLGGLQWDRVRGMIEAIFQNMPNVRVKLYEPKGAPEAKI